MKRKGVSPLIAAVLLIAFTMAVAAILTAWVTTFTKQQTEQLGNQSEQQIDCSFGQISIYSKDSTSNWANVTIVNQGQEAFDNISVTALSGGSVLGTGYVPDLSPGEVGAASIDTGGTQADEVRAATQSCPTVSASATLS